VVVTLMNIIIVPGLFVPNDPPLASFRRESPSLCLIVNILVLVLVLERRLSVEYHDVIQ
jgi:hypothetical protein